jgi:hypothetical protein
MTLSLDGNSMFLRKRASSSLALDPLFGHLKTIRCVLTMIELKEKELTQINIL